MSIQQQQGDEERRRRDEEEQERINAYANAMTKRDMAGADYGPDIGVDGSFGYRERTYNAQIRANIEYSQSLKEKRR